MKLGNIVFAGKNVFPEEVNSVDSLDDIIQGLPTLIVGYTYVDKHYPDFDIFNKELAPNLYWTFKRNEKRDNFEEDVRWFIRKIFLEKAKDVKYVFVDPLQLKRRSLVKVIRKIYSLKNPIAYSNDKMAYIFGEDLIFGIDLRLLKYMGFDIDKIKGKIKKLTTIFLEGSDILIEYKKNLEFFDNQIRYIPFLYTLKNEKEEFDGNLDNG